MLTVNCKPINPMRKALPFCVVPSVPFKAKEAGKHRDEQGDTDGQSRNTQVLAEVQPCVNQRSQGGLSEQRNHGHRQSKSDNDHQHRLAHRRHHQLEAAAAQYLACVDTPQTQRHHREEKVDVVYEGDEHHENGDDKQGDGRGAIARLARMPDIIGKIIVRQLHKMR